MSSSEKHQARIVLALARGRLEQATDLVRRSPVEAETFLRLCRECDVHPRIHAVLAEGSPDLVDASVMDRLAEWREKVRRDNLLLLARTEQALERLGAVGVVPVALKGLDVIHRMLGFDERTLDDVDLLVRWRELSSAFRALDQAGWRLPDERMANHYIRASWHLPLSSPGPVDVGFELHWNIAHEHRYSIDVDSLFERAEPLEIAGHAALRFEDHDFVAHLLLHHFSHYFDRRLKWLVDLEWVVGRPGFRWETVIGRIREWGCTVAAGASLAHLRRLAPETIPEDVAAELAVPGWRRVFTAPLRSDHPLELYRGTRQRRIQLYLAAVMLERPQMLPWWLVHRVRRTQHPGDNPLDPAVLSPGNPDDARGAERLRSHNQRGKR